MNNYFKIFSDENRLRIYLVLKRASLCVCELEIILNLSQPNISKHLSLMKKYQIIKSEKNSLWSIYMIDESFYIKHHYLALYLDNIKEYPLIITQDFKTLKKYLKHNINCELASKHREEVVSILEKTKS